MDLDRLRTLQRDLNQTVVISPRISEFQKMGITDITEIQSHVSRIRTEISALIASEIVRISKISGIDPKTQNKIVLSDFKR